MNSVKALRTLLLLDNENKYKCKYKKNVSHPLRSLYAVVRSTFTSGEGLPFHSPEAQQLTSSLGQSLADSVFSERLCKTECFTFFSVRPKGNIKKNAPLLHRKD